LNFHIRTAVKIVYENASGGSDLFSAFSRVPCFAFSRVPDFYFELYFNAKTVFTKCTKTFSFRHAENPADFRASKIKQQMRTVLLSVIINVSVSAFSAFLIYRRFRFQLVS